MNTNRKMKKGFVSMLELIIVVITLLIAYQVFFPGFGYKSRWSDALLFLKSRDLLITIDRIGKLHEYSYNETELQKFLDSTVSPKVANIIFWSEIEGSRESQMAKNKILIACNCTNEQIVNLRDWLEGIRVNGRNIDAISKICYTQLESTINKCIGEDVSDIVIIWGDGYKNLSSPVYMNTLREYLNAQSGIVEIMDFTDRKQIEEDAAQKDVFGIRWQEDSVVDIEKSKLKFVRTPESVLDITYGPYKYFYNMPVALRTSPSIKVLIGCQPNPPAGELFVNGTKYKFWACDSSSAWFDTNGDGNEDAKVNLNGVFYISGNKFTLKHITTGWLYVSFNPDYEVSNFLYKNPHVYTAANEKKILIQSDKTYASGYNVPAVILNSTVINRIAWMPDFTKDAGGNTKAITDDQRQLLISLLMWTSNKRALGVISPNIKIGYKTSYVNVVNDDMFEVYKFNLGIGYPY